MQLIGQPIKHVTFGKGVVTDWNGNVITVCFSTGEKKFIYPDAFSNFLILKNADAQKKVQHLLDVREEERETELKELQEQQEKKHMLENLKLSPQSQAVFHIDPEQHETVFSSWTVSTGCYLSGYSKGEPRIPERLQPNSMCLLTERPRGCSEAERRIVGAFMVEDDFIGTCCTDGTIQAHSTHRIQLPPERQPLFWPYVAKEPEKQRWGKTAFKYMSNRTGEKVLFDCKENTLTADEKSLAERFYRYYCKLNRLPSRIDLEASLPANG